MPREEAVTADLTDGGRRAILLAATLLALSETPTAEQLLDWLPDHLLLRTRANSCRPASAA